MEGRVDLGSQLESFVDGLVGEGRFESRDAVLREGVRVLQEREQDRAARLAELDAALAEGSADSAAGRVHDMEEAMDDLQTHYRRLAEAQRQQ